MSFNWNVPEDFNSIKQVGDSKTWTGIAKFSSDSSRSEGIANLKVMRGIYDDGQEIPPV